MDFGIVYTYSFACDFPSILRLLPRSWSHGARDGTSIFLFVKPLVAEPNLTALAVSTFIFSKDEEAGQGGWFWNEQVGSYRPPVSKQSNKPLIDWLIDRSMQHKHSNNKHTN